jgi:hypothetical protein
MLSKSTSPAWTSTTSPPADPDPVQVARRGLTGDDATRWIWILYGLTQATLTTLVAFGVLDTVTPSAVVTAVALILYVAVNELLVRPRRR